MVAKAMFMAIGRYSWLGLSTLLLSLVPPTISRAIVHSPSAADNGATPVSAQVCLDLPTWQRPARQTQEKQLRAMANSAPAIQQEPPITTIKTWWSYQIFSFTTYGLSARTEPLYFSGLWTAIDSLWSCYQGDQPDRINRGELAELWLIQNRLLNIRWLHNQYIITVEPAQSGLQLVHLTRHEAYPNLPLVIVTPTGARLPTLSGDW
ncbi:MAG: hypothetical protein ACOYMP_05145 [Nodosilinea sp.]